MFYSPLNSTLSFSLDLQVLPSSLRYLVSINKCRLDSSRLVIYTTLNTYVSPCRTCFSTESVFFAFFYLWGSSFLLAVCFLPPNSCFTANFFHCFFFSLLQSLIFHYFRPQYWSISYHTNHDNFKNFIASAIQWSRDFLIFKISLLRFEFCGSFVAIGRRSIW